MRSKWTWRTVVDLGLRVAAVGLLVFAVMVLATDSANLLTRHLVMVGSVILWIAVAGYQVVVALREDGAPRRFPLTFRWVFAIWKLSLALFITWHLLVSLFDVYSREVSLLVWMLMGQGGLLFFRRWVTLVQSRTAEQGETGTDGGTS